LGPRRVVEENNLQAPVARLPALRWLVSNPETLRLLGEHALRLPREQAVALAFGDAEV
jgi:hypothetical protein